MSCSSQPTVLEPRSEASGRYVELPADVAVRGDLAGSVVSRVERALAELRAGRMVVVSDDHGREDEADLIMAAEFAHPDAVGFMIRHTSGVLCVAVPPRRADELKLPLMVQHGDDPRGTAFTISVDLAVGTTTGISASDRSATMRALGDPRTIASDFSRPGHVFPLRSRPGGVLSRAGHTEAAVDLCVLAGLEPAGVLCELVNDDGTMMRGHGVVEFAERHQLVRLSVADVARYRSLTQTTVKRIATNRVTTVQGRFAAVTYRSLVGDTQALALVRGEVGQRETRVPVPVRIHRECAVGEIFNVEGCDCGSRMQESLMATSVVGAGAVIHIRGNRRPTSLTSSLPCPQGDDVVTPALGGCDATALGVAELDFAAQILRDLHLSHLLLAEDTRGAIPVLAEHGLTASLEADLSDGGIPAQGGFG